MVRKSFSDRSEIAHCRARLFGAIGIKISTNNFLEEESVTSSEL